jgi:hypothetical protein
VQQQEDCGEKVYDNQKSKQFYLSITAACRDTGLITVGCGRTGQKEEEGCSFYVVYKQVYIHERQECTRKCITWKETVNVMKSTVLRYRADG